MADQSRTAQISLLRTLIDETEEPKALPLQLLTEITNGFSDKLEIGKGGFAVVYKGMLEDRAVAVKKLSNTYMYENEFQRELECLMKVRHKNIARFLGYCIDNQGNVASADGTFVIAESQQRLLCFEYLTNGSLCAYIKDASGGLSWRTRYQIIKGICEGLHYLHEINIIHLDLKPANVLLDEEMVPKITDFGLSRCFKDDQTHFTASKMGGTSGYLAPESYSRRPITYKFDLYSLGVMITEIITGDRGYQDVNDILANWSNRCEQSQWEQIRVCTEIGLECSDFNPQKRPESMKHIIDRLAETETFPVTAEGALLSISPSTLFFPWHKKHEMHSSLHLTNTTDQFVAFHLATRSGLQSFIDGPHYGYVPPRSAYTLVVGTNPLYSGDLEEMVISDLNLISATCQREQILSYRNGNKYNAIHEFFKNMKLMEVALKALSIRPREMGIPLSKPISPGIKELRRDEEGKKVYCLDTDHAKQWIIVGEDHGKITIWDNRTQDKVHSMKLSRERVTCVKFIARKQWLVVGTKDGYIHVYKCETKMMKITSFRATAVHLKSLAVHPTQSYLLSADHCGMKLWDWDKGFECIHNFEKEHSKKICHVAFNMNDTIASASKDHLVKVWILGSAKSKYTLSGHSNKVNCLDFFTCDGKEYLVTGSDDETAKIWDMQTNICIHTLEVFVSPVMCVVYEPSLQILITGSLDGCIYYWNTLNSYRLERIIDTGTSYGAVHGLACLTGRTVAGRKRKVLIVDIDNVNNYEGGYNEPQLLAGDSTCEVTPAAGSITQPDLYPLAFFRHEEGPCSLHLTNKTDEHVAFLLTDKSGCFGFPETFEDTTVRNEEDVSRALMNKRPLEINFVKVLPYGIVPPKSTCTLIFPRYWYAPHGEMPELFLKSSISGDRYTFLFADLDECNEYFREEGNTVHVVSVEDGYTMSEEICYQMQSMWAQLFSPRVKITSNDRRDCSRHKYRVHCMDAHPTEPWIITGNEYGFIYRWSWPYFAVDDHNQNPESTKEAYLELEGAVCAIKIITRTEWILVGSDDGVIHVCSYANYIDYEMQRITTFRAPDDYRVSFLEVHPTQSYVVLSKQLPESSKKGNQLPNIEMEVWGWDNGWKRTHTSGADGDMLSFVIAADHGVKQVPGPDSPKSDRTLRGHLDRVNCLHYFTRDDRKYLITGSDDCTAKIWDVEKKACIHTMAQEAIMSSVTSVISLLPHHPYLLTGTEHGTVQVWNCTDFRLERTVNFGGAGPVRGLAFLMGMPSVVIVQEKGLSIMEFHNEVEEVC